MKYTTSQLLDSIERVSTFINKNKRTPKIVKINKTELTWKEYKQIPQIKELQTRIQNYINKHNAYPSYVLCFNKFKLKHSEYIYIWTFDKPHKQVEKTDDIYTYFIKQFGKVNTIDEALQKVKEKGYSYYYDDVYTNITSINRMKKGLGINCTDSVSVFYHIAKQLDYEVKVIHCQCTTGGHVRLQLKHKKHTSGNWINRDPACVLSKNGKPLTSIWCPNAPVIGVNPNWFMKNVNR